MCLKRFFMCRRPCSHRKGPTFHVEREVVEREVVDRVHIEGLQNGDERKAGHSQVLDSAAALPRTPRLVRR